MRFAALISTAALMLAGCGPASAAPPFAPYPETKPGTVYHYIAYEADEAGKLQKKGKATMTIEKPVKVGANEYVRLTRKVAGNDFGEERYRFGDAFWLLEDPNSEASLIRVFDNPPKAGAEIQNATTTTKVVAEKDPTIEGATYKNLLTVEYHTAGILRLRYVIDREVGHVKSTIFNAGRKALRRAAPRPAGGPLILLSQPARHVSHHACRRRRSQRHLGKDRLLSRRL